MTKKQFPGAGRFDSTNSTYKHKIHLLNNKELTGYSKGVYVSEPHDKIVLLERVIRRLTNNGYLQPQRTHRIEFYYNKFLEGNDEIILTLYRDHYELGNVEEIITDFRLHGFLKKFYEELNQGKMTVQPHKPILSSEEQRLDWKKPRFKTQDQLHFYVLKLLEWGYAHAVAADFFRKYKEQHFQMIK